MSIDFRIDVEDNRERFRLSEVYSMGLSFFLSDISARCNMVKAFYNAILYHPGISPFYLVMMRGASIKL